LFRRQANYLANIKLNSAYCPFGVGKSSLSGWDQGEAPSPVFGGTVLFHMVDDAP